MIRVNDSLFGDLLDGLMPLDFFLVHVIYINTLVRGGEVKNKRLFGSSETRFNLSTQPATEGSQISRAGVIIPAVWVGSIKPFHRGLLQYNQNIDVLFRHKSNNLWQLDNQAGMSLAH